MKRLASTLQATSANATLMAALLACMVMATLTFWTGSDSALAAANERAFNTLTSSLAARLSVSSRQDRILSEPEQLVGSTVQVTEPTPDMTANPRYRIDDPQAYVYTIRHGESWRSIAQRFDVTYESLRAVNEGLWAFRGVAVRPGDEIAIPERAAEEMIPTIEQEVKPGDSWYGIADEHGVTYWDLRSDNIALWQRRGIFLRPGDTLTVRNSRLASVELLDIRGFEDAVYARMDREKAEVEAGSGVMDAVSGGEAGGSEVAAFVDDSAVLTLADAGTVVETNGYGNVVVVSAPSDAEIYVVRPGDSWYSIAAGFGLGYWDLRGVNSALWQERGSQIRANDQMVIPAHDQTQDPPNIKTAPVDLASEQKPDVAPALSIGDTSEGTSMEELGGEEDVSVQSGEDAVAKGQDGD